MKILYMTVFKFNLGVQLQTWTVEQLYEFLSRNHEKGAFLWWGMDYCYSLVDRCLFFLIFPFFIFLFFVFPENSNHLKSLSKCSEKSERVYSAMRDANLESLLVIF